MPLEGLPPPSDIPAVVVPTVTTLRKALVVLGMHRSGTSAITRTLSLLGSDLPRHLMPPLAGDNARGFWESQPLADLHDEMLAEMGSSWHDIPPLHPQWQRSPRAKSYIPRFVRCLGEEFGESAFFVLKDPRVCQLVPLWLEILGQFGATPHFILIVRNPLEVAQSLRARDGFALGKSLMLWLQHVLAAEFATRGQPRSFVAYGALLSDWRRAVEKIRSELNLCWPRDDHRAHLEIEEFLSPCERHHAISDDEVSGHAAVPAWLSTAYAALRGMVQADSAEGRAVLDAVRQDVASAEQAYGPILAQYKLQNERCQQQGLQRPSPLGAAWAELAELRKARAEQAAAIERYRCAAAADQLRDEQRRAELAACQAELDRQRGQVSQLQQELAAGRGVIAEKSRQADQLQQALGTCQSELAVVRSHGVDLADRLNAELASKDDQRVKLSRVLAAHDAEIRHLQATVTEERAQRSGLQAEIERLRQQTTHVGLGGRLLRRLSTPFPTGRKLVVRVKSAVSGRIMWRRHVAALRSRGLAGAVKPAIFPVRLRRRPAEQILRAPLFDAAWYLKHYPDVAEAGIDPLQHFLARGVAEGRQPSPLFDTTWYRLQYADVAASGINPLLHFLCQGAVEGRRPHPLFDWECLAQQGLGGSDAGVHPLASLIEPGNLECPTPNPYFDVSWYLAQNPDVAAAGVNPVTHYLETGWIEGRNPGPLFDNDWYLRHYPDVPRINPLAHYLCYGMAQGRAPHPALQRTFCGPLPAGPVSLDRHPQPRVSIVVSGRRSWLHTLWCLRSIHANAEGVAYEVIVADDSPVGETPAIAQLVANLRTIGSSDRARLADSARGQYLLMLPNDALLQPGSLAGLVEMAQQQEKMTPPVCRSDDFVYLVREADGIVRPCLGRCQASPDLDSDEAVLVCRSARGRGALPALLAGAADDDVATLAAPWHPNVRNAAA